MTVVQPNHEWVKRLSQLSGLSRGELHSSALSAAAKGDWQEALINLHGLKTWRGMSPFAYALKMMPQYGMPDHAVQDVLPYLEQSSADHDDFVHEMSQNLTDEDGKHRDYSSDTLSRLWKLASGYFERNEFESHPNFKINEDEAKIHEVANFWHDYERDVRAEHFAVVRSLHTNKPEILTDHRGNQGTSDDHEHLREHFEKYAKLCQEQVLEQAADGSGVHEIKIRYFNGRPHVQCYRGVGGNYAKALRHAAGFSNGRVQKRVLSMKTAPFSSWTLDPMVAEGFASSRGNIDGQENGHGIVIRKWMPLHDLMHAGFHDVVPGQRHAHPTEYELVFRHCDERVKLPTSCFYKHQTFLDPVDGDFSPTSVEPTKAKPQKELASVDMKKFEEDIESWFVQTGLKKADSNLFGGLEPDSEILQDMHGFQPHLETVFAAARFLVGGKEAPLDALRRAIYDADGDLVTAALQAYGLEDTEKNRNALKAVAEIRETKKAEEKPPLPATAVVVAGHTDGEASAEAVRRAIKGAQVMSVQLGGKHSKGSLVARDPETKQSFLLKPGSGPQSPAAGARDDSSSQSQREAAFWHMARVWGIDRDFPRCDLLLIDGHQYACMHLLPWSYKPMEKRRDKDPNEPRKDLEPYRQRGDLHRWAVIDFVLGNPDRHAQNIMVGEHGDVKLIDHGSAFAGRGFDPSFDRDSFIPFYLRYACPQAVNFNKLKAEEKAKHMPSCPRDGLEMLRRWVQGLQAADLEHVLAAYGIDPAPEVERLARVKALLERGPLDEGINRLWAGT